MRTRRDRELEEEIRGHFRMAVEERMARGESRDEAERNARLEFGNLLLVREVTRGMWGWSGVEAIFEDVKYALRQMGRKPGFTFVALMTLALGLGATTVIFSIVNGVLLQPLAFHQPDRLYMAENIPDPSLGVARKLLVNARHFYEWRAHCDLCQDVALFEGNKFVLAGAGEPVLLPALDVSYNFFRTLGVQPAIGRDFVASDEICCGGPGTGALILSDELWRSRFAADPSIVGRRIQLIGELWTVVGVLPRGLHLPRGEEWGASTAPPAAPLIFRVWMRYGPLSTPAGNLNYSSVIRLKDGVRAEQAEAELNGLLAGFVREYKLQYKVGLSPLRQEVIRKDRGPLLLLLGAVGAVLLIVCVNIGNLMLVRTASRYREAAIRLALGASRLRLFRLVLTEALVLVASGGIAGLALARVGLRIFVARAPVAIPRLDEVQMDWRVFAFAIALMGLSTLVCGIVPAWRLARIEPQESLRGGSATEGRLWFREVMVGLEVALTAVLLIAGGLLMASFFRLLSVDKGFDVAHIVTQDVSFFSAKYAHGVARAAVEDVTEKLKRVPGVDAVGAVSQLPLMGEMWVDTLKDSDVPARPGDDNAVANFRFVTPDYFKAMGISLKKGRFLEEGDKGRATAVVSASAARFLWGDQNPIGKHVRGVGRASPALEVVGVVGEVRGKLEDAPPMMVYEHFWRMNPFAMSYVLRTRADPATMEAGIRAVLSSADPEMAIPKARTMEQILEGSVAARKFQMYLAVAFAMSALALASLGIYGVISFMVARRTPEMGIRIALGASGGQLVGMVVRQGMVPVAAGLVAGLAASLFVTRLIVSQLYGVAPNDPFYIGGVAVLLVAVGIAACWIPARRATRIDAMTALRFE